MRGIWTLLLDDACARRHRIPQTGKKTAPRPNKETAQRRNSLTEKPRAGLPVIVDDDAGDIRQRLPRFVQT